MSEQSIDAKAEDQFSDILLVLDKRKKKIEAVKGMGKNGELKTVPANKKMRASLCVSISMVIYFLIFSPIF